jgi:hypothetical protein
MSLDREYQHELLKQLAESYPLPFDIRQIARAWDDAAEFRYAANMCYLEEHGLVEANVTYGLDHHLSFSLPKITARGLDFLADDGGLSAILGVVTVKIHEESLRALLLAKAESLSGATPEEQSAVVEAVRNLPARSIQTVADKLIALGVEHLPTGAHQLHIWLDQAISSLRGAI